ncbi:MAG: hypothetical protein EOP06_05435 [Proteobacteria bacterium]|nr:MAG: hypothetical protein EOP06_05435 [Pseudomonadota bacterium]
MKFKKTKFIALMFIAGMFGSQLAQAQEFGSGESGSPIDWVVPEKIIQTNLVPNWKGVRGESSPSDERKTTCVGMEHLGDWGFRPECQGNLALQIADYELDGNGEINPFYFNERFTHFFSDPALVIGNETVDNRRINQIISVKVGPIVATGINGQRTQLVWVRLMSPEGNEEIKLAYEPNHNKKGFLSLVKLSNDSGKIWVNTKLFQNAPVTGFVAPRFNLASDWSTIYNWLKPIGIVGMVPNFGQRD